MKRTRLIINADDYGVTERVSQGIREAHINGVVTSTSAVMNGKEVIRDLKYAKLECPNLGIGIHLVISAGSPLLSPEKVKTLITSNGEFINIRDIQKRFELINFNEIEYEWRAQIELFLGTGIELDHLDSHHNASYMHERIFEIMVNLAAEYNVPIRNPYAAIELDAGNISIEVINSIEKFVPRLISNRAVKFPDRMIPNFFREGATLGHLLEILEELPEGDFELMCHPGYSDDYLKKHSSYNAIRETELMILTSPVIKDRLEKLSIELIQYKDL